METDINLNNQTEFTTREPEFVIQPSKGWGGLQLGELWKQRYLIWVLTSREIKGRYRQMALGPLWIVLNPLANMVVFSFIFGELANLPSDELPYPIFAYTALLPWTYFSTATNNSVTSLISNMNLISKVYFNRLVIPVAAVLSGLVDLAINFLILLGLMIYYHRVPTLNTLFLPVFISLATATALGIGLWTAALSVRFRDLGYGVGMALRVWMYVTPVAYSASLIPEKWQTLYQLNPLYWVVEGFRWALLGSELEFSYLAYLSGGFVLIILLSGAFVLRRTERTVVDLL